MSMSQEEIDKLMTSEGSEEPPGESPPAPPSGEPFDFPGKFGELFCQSVQNIFPILVSTDSVKISTTSVDEGNLNDIISALPTGSVYYIFKFIGLSDSYWVGMMDMQLALSLSQRMMGQDADDELSEALLSALNEAFLNLLGSLSTSLADEFKIDVDKSDLNFLSGDVIPAVEAETNLTGDSPVSIINFEIGIDDLTGTMAVIIGSDTLEEIKSKHPVSTDEPVAAAPEPEELPDLTVPEEPSEEPVYAESASKTGPEVQKATFEEFGPRQPSGDSMGIDLILDVPLSLSVELGRKTLTVQEILSLTPGSLVEIEKLAGEAVDLLVNGKLLAKGEVVVIDENFGVRITSIVTPRERIESLR